MKSIYSLDTWILFLILIIPVVFQNTTFGGAFSIFVFLLGVLWFYNLTIDLFKILPGGHSMNISKFKFHFFFPLAYFTIAIIATGGYSINSNNIDEYGGFGIVLVLLHIFSMYCIFYCIYFTSKALISAYNKVKNPEWTSYIGYFFAFWIMPIGIWFIQPKVKKLFAAQ